jgi:hypothetical protein
MSYSKLETRNRAYETEVVNLNEVHVPERTLERIMRKDHGQIENLRRDYENGRSFVRVVLRPRCGGGYNVEDGRHRVIAAKIAGESFIEAIIIG